MTDLDHLGREKYILLTTFRRDGRAVSTAVWSARDGDSLFVWTVADSGKVKRIRNSGEVTVGPCSFRGAPRGDSLSAHASLVDAADSKRVRGLIGRKYGLIGRLSMLGSRLRRGPRRFGRHPDLPGLNAAAAGCRA
jgi:PPOX class probable F420-dependent enzyme